MSDQILEESSSLLPIAEIEVTVTTSERETPPVEMEGIEENGGMSPLPALPPDLPPPTTPPALPAGLPPASPPPAPSTSCAPLPPRPPLPPGAPLPSPMVFDSSQPPPLQPTVGIVPFKMGRIKKKVEGSNPKKFAFSFCHDYLNSICTRNSCYFYHGNLEEEEYYKNFGKLPPKSTTATTLQGLGKRPGDAIPINAMNFSVPPPSLPVDTFVSSNGDDAHKRKGDQLHPVHPGVVPPVTYGGVYDLPGSNPGLRMPVSQIQERSLLRDQAEQLTITSLLEEKKNLQRQVRQRDAVIEHMTRYAMRCDCNGVSVDPNLRVVTQLAQSGPQHQQANAIHPAPAIPQQPAMVPQPIPAGTQQQLASAGPHPLMVMAPQQMPVAPQTPVAPQQQPPLPASVPQHQQPPQVQQQLHQQLVYQNPLQNGVSTQAREQVYNQSTWTTSAQRPVDAVLTQSSPIMISTPQTQQTGQITQTRQYNYQPIPQQHPGNPPAQPQTMGPVQSGQSQQPQYYASQTYMENTSNSNRRSQDQRFSSQTQAQSPMAVQPPPPRYA